MRVIPIDALILVALALFAVFFRWISKEAEKSKRKSEQSQRTPEKPANVQSREETDEQRMRRFLEALGQPSGSKPPAPVTRRPTFQKPVVVPHVGPFGSPLPPLTTKPPDLPRRVTLPGQITQPPYEEKTFKPIAAEASFEIHEAPLVAPPAPLPPIKSPAEAYLIASQPKPVPKQFKTSVVSLLRSASGLRDVVILREIFGPPRGLQTIEF